MKQILYIQKHLKLKEIHRLEKQKISPSSAKRKRHHTLCRQSLNQLETKANQRRSKFFNTSISTVSFSYIDQLFWRETGVLDIPTDDQLFVKSFSFAGAGKIDISPLVRIKAGTLVKRGSIAP